MQKASNLHPDNADVSLEYGKTLVESERAFEAVRHLENAVAMQPGNWTALSAYGVALDQIGEHEDARKKYDRALAMAPNAVSVLNNKGLSYALDGNLSMARATLREAAAAAGGDARIRQNLALVLALSGEMAEAERLARSDLPPQLADNNIDFFRQLMNQPAYWGEYAAAGADVPDFDAAPLKTEPKPQLHEAPKPGQQEKSDGAPLSLLEPTTATKASASEDAQMINRSPAQAESVEIKEIDDIQ
jgi:tetratricopeptide (TPR) repeat protein